MSLGQGINCRLSDCKDAFVPTGVRAASAVNRELVFPYRSIGRNLASGSTGKTRWEDRGSAVKNPQAEVRGVEGFSPGSLRYIRAFGRLAGRVNFAQVAAKLPWVITWSCSTLEFSDRHGGG
jgi:hypothetical protein